MAMPSAARACTAAFVSWRRRKPSYWTRSAAVSSAGEISFFVNALRMSPRHVLTASTKARLACFGACAAASAATVPVAFEQVPPVGDLPGVRKRAGDGRPVAAPAVARHDLDARPFGAPCLDRAGLPLGQDVDDAVPREITEDRPVAVAFLPRPLVDADHPRRHGLAAARRPRARFAGGCPCSREREAAGPCPARDGPQTRGRDSGPVPETASSGAPRTA